MKPLTFKTDMKLVHRFRSKVLGVEVVRGRLVALTEHGGYYQQPSGRWRKIILAPPALPRA